MMIFVLQVGAPPEIASFLDEIRRENDFCNRDAVSTCLGADPELDEFMVPPPPLCPLALSFPLSLFPLYKYRIKVLSSIAS